MTVNPGYAGQKFLNNQVTVIRPEKYDEYDDIEDKVLFNEYNTKKMSCCICVHV